MIYTVNFTHPSFPQRTTQECIQYFKEKLSSGKLKSIAIDTETTGFNPLDCSIVTLQLGDSDNQFVVSIGSIFDLQDYKELLEANILILHNAKFDTKFLHTYGVNPERLWDTLLAEGCLYRGLKVELSLKALLKRYLNIELDKTEQTTFTQYGELTKEQIIYAAKDVEYLHKIAERQILGLKSKDLLDYALFENKAITPLASIELNGMYLNMAAWLDYAAKAAIRVAEYEEQLNQMLTKDAPETSLQALYDEIIPKTPKKLRLNPKVNWRSSKQVLGILRMVYGIHPKDKKGKPSSGEYALQTFKKKHPFVELLFKHRETAKEISTYGEEFVKKNIQSDGRVRTSFWQIKDTGRVSSSSPNMQNIPKQHREFFEAEKGNKLIILDYAAMEPRITAHYCQDEALIEFFKQADADIHNMVASKMFSIIEGKEVIITKTDEDKRYIGKQTGLKLDYGGTSFTLQHTLGKSQEESQSFIDAYWAAFPGKRAFFNAKIHETLSTGYILCDTILRSKTFISDFAEYNQLKKTYPLSKEQNKQRAIKQGSIQRTSQNYPIQATSALITKQALIYAYQTLKPYGIHAKLVNVVHDEIVIEAKEKYCEEIAEKTKQDMIKAGAIYCSTVPMVIEPIISKLWKK